MPSILLKTMTSEEPTAEHVEAWMVSGGIEIALLDGCSWSCFCVVS